ncbi:hypothetical protein [Arthrobacter sp. CAN_A1]|uniref:hypothetical protein n=1 Tax=Arthrobacter sp. CAN_A1 TaxID=2787717 RepID=UPI0018CA59AC
MGTEKDDTNRVIITEVGAPGDRYASHDGRDTGNHAGQQSAGDGTASRPVAGRRVVNPFFVAAWLLAALMTAVGVMSVTSSLQGMNPYLVYMPVQGGLGESSPYQTFMSLLVSPLGAGPLLLVAGCLLAGLLLAVHGINHSRRPPAGVSAVQS